MAKNDNESLQFTGDYAERRKADRRGGRAAGTQWLLIVGIAAAVVEIAILMIAFS